MSRGLWRLEKKILRTRGNIGQRLTWGWWKGLKYVSSLQTCSPPNLWVQTEVRHLVKRLWKPYKYLEIEITDEMWLKIWRKCDQKANCKSVRLICRHHGVLSQVRILPIYSQFIFRISEFACWCWMSRCGIFRGNFWRRANFMVERQDWALQRWDGGRRPLKRLRRPLVLAKVPIKGHWNIMEAVWKQNKAWTRLLHGNGQPHPNLVRPKTNREDSAP